MNYTLHHGDNREVLRTMPDNSVDSIVTDPPYELGFMGKKWDSTGIAYDATLWAECLRVLKPGGHLIAFGGTRTYHRMTVAIEDAGFEIRDCIQWIYGSGFPKSLDVSKAIDKKGGASVDFVRFRDAVIDAMKRNNITRKQLESALGNYMLSHYLTAGSQPAVPNYRDYCIIRDTVCLGNEFDELFNESAEREVAKEVRSDMFGEYEVDITKISGIANKNESPRHTIGASQSVEVTTTAPATPEAQQWHGFGTALKPANEPAVLARKPLSGTVADNVLTWGCGALNIDGCRVGTSKEIPGSANGKGGKGIVYAGGFGPRSENHTGFDASIGRWPANVILDEEAAQMLDEQSGERHGGGHARHCTGSPSVARGKFVPTVTHGHSDSGGASRFFYVAKASKAEREAGLDGMEVQRRAGLQGSDRDGEIDPLSERWRTSPRANHHPTVKPITLMRYLVRLVTPPGGTVLDPFMGSGSTGCAAMLEGMDFVGIELSAEYLEIAEQRIAHHAEQNPMGL